MKCCLCKNEIEVVRNWADGNSAEPLEKNGRCCDFCDNMYVIPTRFKLIQIAKLNGKISKVLVKSILSNLQRIKPEEVSKEDGLMDFYKLKERIEIKEAICLLNYMGVSRKYLLEKFFLTGMIIGHLLAK